MGKYLITGVPGSGKSTVIEAIKKRGFAAYDSENMPAVTRLKDKQTGKPADWPPHPVNWDRYAFNWQKQGLQKILASDSNVFVAASVSNQEKFYHLFDQLFILAIDGQTLRRRLLTRDKEYGKHPDDLAGILAYRPKRQRELLQGPKAVRIDAAQPLEKVVDDLLGYRADFEGNS